MNQTLRKVQTLRLLPGTWNQCQQRLRHKGAGTLFSRNPDPKHPTPGPIERRVLEAITTPILQKELPDKTRSCSRLQARKEQPIKEEDNAYESFLIRRCMEVFDQHKTVIVCQPYSLKAKELGDIWNGLMDHGLRLTFSFPSSVLRQTVADSRYQNLMPLFNFKTRLVVSEEVKVKEAMSVLRKMPQMLVLGGLINETIYSRAGLLALASLPDLDTLLGQTCGILNMAASKTYSLLQHQQQKLVSNLDQYSRDQS